ncbi:DUF3810 domain-containing protein [Mucilaginibacter daejeonensis]|uniref:DUF3810 domain-containing protein n=1 Tax=Mucilaginibacter daejeonensis TaxID=398049 RepID=UPI001D178474|nr:DUF3810 domain-containing protein [Mucilaginibacter daejeonensis]UEG52017.1 DUF3810 domain-containing protein [Mucilaginibacter daejeonensis]
MPLPMGRTKPLIIERLYLTGTLAMIMLLLFIAGEYPLFIERYYSNGLYRAISVALHFTLGWIPFSVGDVLYTAIIVIALYATISLIASLFKKRFARSLRLFINLVIGLQLFIIAFYILWGLNYSRPPASQLLNIPDSTYTTSALIGMTCTLIDSANACRARLNADDLSTTNKQIYDTAEAAIERSADIYPQFRSYYPAVKSSLFTPVINYLSTAGYFTPFTGEAQVNYQMPLHDRPVSACHEMAHQMGFAREDEANFVGYLAGIHSNDRSLRYSAYYLAMQEFIHQVRRRDSTASKQFKTHLSPAVLADLKADRAYWQRYDRQISRLSGIFYDNFLKVNKQPEGLRTYNRMIILTMGYYAQKRNESGSMRTEDR